MAELHLNPQAETETNPVMEIHVGEPLLGKFMEGVQGRMSDSALQELDDQFPDLEPGTIVYTRHCIIWINGKRWEGTLTENTAKDLKKS